MQPEHSARILLVSFLVKGSGWTLEALISPHRKASHVDVLRAMTDDVCKMIRCSEEPRNTSEYWHAAKK